MALETLLNDIGSASFMLTTIIVGLDAVEHDYPKPDGVNVSWEPQDRIAAARMARKFAVESFIVRAAEVLKAYTLAISVFPRFDAIRSKWDGKTGTAKKLDDVANNVFKLDDEATNVLGKDQYLVAGGMLLLFWRNKIIHKGNLRIPSPKKNLLRKYEVEIAAAYGDLSIDCLLCHAAEGRPTLKDASSLIAMSINLARLLDEQIYKGLTREDVIAWIKYYDLVSALVKVVRETSPDRLQVSIERVFHTHAPGLYGDYKKFFGDAIPEIT